MNGVFYLLGGGLLYVTYNIFIDVFFLKTNLNQKCILYLYISVIDKV